MTEDQLLAEVLDMCELRSIQAFHVFDSRISTGKGFPDLVLTGRRRTIFVELKNPWGNLSSEQTAWRYALQATGQHFEVWRPEDLKSGHIERVLETL